MYRHFAIKSRTR
uniref:Uncharacterized protein n=1 Tax=Rhizophora mucronata TaxID=61149 RepID=A0A2P2R4H5_RHIMU